MLNIVATFIFIVFNVMTKQSAEGSILTASQNVTFDVNSTVTFHCVTNTSSSIRWHYYRTPDGSRVVIFNGKRANASLSDRFVLTQADVRSSLTIKQVLLSDSGTYLCLESKSASNRATFELSISASRPDRRNVAATSPLKDRALSVTTALSERGDRLSAVDETGSASFIVPLTVCSVVVCLLVLLTVIFTRCCRPVRCQSTDGSTCSKSTVAESHYERHRRTAVRPRTLTSLSGSSEDNDYYEDLERNVRSAIAFPQVYENYGHGGYASHGPMSASPGPTPDSPDSVYAPLTIKHANMPTILCCRS